MRTLMADELDLLQWLSREDWSLYGECSGKALNALLALGLARLAWPEPDDWTGVALTPAGLALATGYLPLPDDAPGDG